MDKLRVNLGENSYDICFTDSFDGLCAALKEINAPQKLLVVTDTNVEKLYADEVNSILLNNGYDSAVYSFPAGEEMKGMDSILGICRACIEHGLDRKSMILALGGGVVGDMAGFAAASFMRGIDFYNIPTTVLSEVDSSIGGKTAIDFCGLKNIIGAFHQPKGVIVDVDTLSTLSDRMISNGLAEALKMAATHDKELFDIFENGQPLENLEEIIERSLRIKKSVVESDEKESGVRKVLNFGHTVGHAIESNTPSLYHGECVALGMLPMCSQSVRERLVSIFRKLNLPIETECDYQRIIDAMRHDKKMSGDNISAVFVDEIGSFIIEKLPFDEFCERIKAVY